MVVSVDTNGKLLNDTKVLIDTIAQMLIDTKALIDTIGYSDSDNGSTQAQTFLRKGEFLAP